MPLKPGYSRETFEANYQLLRREGKAHNVALAAAYNAARESYFKAHPHGALPMWLTPPGGQRLNQKRKKNPCGCGGKRSDLTHLECPTCRVKTPHTINHNPAAAEYHYQCAYCGTFKPYGRIPPKPSRRPNPVPESSRSGKHSKESRIKAAGDLYTRFTGHDATELVSIDKPELPDVMLVVGDIDGVLYTTERDGQVEKYIHKFNKKCRPLFCVSHDGKQLYMLGGSYDFTERGIVDRT